MRIVEGSRVFVCGPGQYAIPRHNAKAEAALDKIYHRSGELMWRDKVEFEFDPPTWLTVYESGEVPEGLVIGYEAGALGLKEGVGFSTVAPHNPNLPCITPIGQGGAVQYEGTNEPGLHQLITLLADRGVKCIAFSGCDITDSTRALLKKSRLKHVVIPVDGQPFETTLTIRALKGSRFAQYAPEASASLVETSSDTKASENQTSPDNSDAGSSG